MVFSLFRKCQKEARRYCGQFSCVFCTAHPIASCRKSSALEASQHSGHEPFHSDRSHAHGDRGWYFPKAGSEAVPCNSQWVSSVKESVHSPEFFILFSGIHMQLLGESVINSQAGKSVFQCGCKYRISHSDSCLPKSKKNINCQIFAKYKAAFVRNTSELAERCWSISHVCTALRVCPLLEERWTWPVWSTAKTCFLFVFQF